MRIVPAASQQQVATEEGDTTDEEWDSGGTLVLKKDAPAQPGYMSMFAKKSGE